MDLPRPPEPGLAAHDPEWLRTSGACATGAEGIREEVEGPRPKGDRPLVLLVVSEGWTVRNYLLTGFLRTLLKSCRVVVCSPFADEPEFVSLCESEGVSITPRPAYDQGWLHRRIGVRRQLYHYVSCDTETYRIKLQRGRSWYGRFANARASVDQRIAKILAGPSSRKLLDALDARLRAASPEAQYYRDLLKSLRPDLVFATNAIGQDEFLSLYMAQSLGIPTAAAVMSWDNLSSKGRLPRGCSRYIVWTEVMKQELLGYYPEIAPERVVVGGAPQFDFHFDPRLRDSREEFCAANDLDPQRPIVVYGGVTPGLMPGEPKVVGNLVEMVRSGAIEGNPNILVRLHPVDHGERYRDFARAYPEARLIVVRPEDRTSERIVGSIDDLRELVNTVVHGDVHLNVASTLAVDCAVLDTPVVNVRYSMDEVGEPRPPGLDIYDYTHYLPVVATGGVVVSESPRETAEHVNQYLANPSKDREGRARIVASVCGQLDSRAGERSAAIISGMVQAQG
jgi:hypothetical protein